jgi:hypothetical protein
MNRPPSSFLKPPARGRALESAPQAGLVSPAGEALMLHLFGTDGLCVTCRARASMLARYDLDHAGDCPGRVRLPAPVPLQAPGPRLCPGKPAADRARLPSDDPEVMHR